MNTGKSRFIKSVRDQYEDHPYPPRDPEQDRITLIKTELDSLGKISHYCFNGNFDPDNGARFLIAGGGTGDATIFLAEQLREYNAEVVHLDLSSASMDIAKKRASIRGLRNITWIQGSILDLPQVVDGKFDYINCCGVLHHLENPVKGLLALKACLNESGAIGIMVYAKYGRTGIYHMQELMRLINHGEIQTSEKIANTKRTFECLPDTHCLKSGPIPLTEVKFSELEDSDLVDLFLHTQDRPYTVTEIYGWLKECGLQLVDFVCNKPKYEPVTQINNSDLLRKIDALPKPAQQAIAENIVSTIYRHMFYVSFSRHTIATLNDSDNIPYFCDLLPLTEAETLHLQKLVTVHPENSTLKLHFPSGNTDIMLPVGKLTRHLVKHINGKNSIKAIIRSVRRENDLAPYKLTSKTVLRELQNLYKLFFRHNAMLLRNKRISPYRIP